MDWKKGAFLDGHCRDGMGALSCFPSMQNLPHRTPPASTAA